MPASKTTKKKSTKKSARTTTAKKKPSAAKAKATKAGEKEVKMDRRRQDDRREEETLELTSPIPERREKVQRRRQIDPTTCERDYSTDEVEFMNAMDEYKRTSGRMFPTCSEVLEVIRDLGYTRLSPAELALKNEENSDATPVVDATASTEDDDFESNLESQEIVSDGWTV